MFSVTRSNHCTNVIGYAGGFWVAASIAESLTSIAGRVSYSVGAWRIIPAVPTGTKTGSPFTKGAI